MGKPTICIDGKKKAQISFSVTAKLISAFVFTTQIVQCLCYLTPKFQASSLLLCLYRPVCVGPVRKPLCWFSHEAAHFIMLLGYSQLQIHLCTHKEVNLVILLYIPDVRCVRTAVVATVSYRSISAPTRGTNHISVRHAGPRSR